MNFFGKLHGFIKSDSSRQAYGFIRSVETKSDIHFRKQDLPEELAWLDLVKEADSTDYPVQFRIFRVGEKKFQAKTIQVHDCTQQPWKWARRGA